MPRHISHGACLLTLVLCGCGASTATNEALDLGNELPEDRGCADPARPISSGCGTLAWSPSPVVSRGRSHHVTISASTAAGSFLYVIGGLDGQEALAEVDRVPVQPDGSLDAQLTSSTEIDIGTF